MPSTVLFRRAGGFAPVNGKASDRARRLAAPLAAVGFIAATVWAMFAHSGPEPNLIAALVMAGLLGLAVYHAAQARRLATEKIAVEKTVRELAEAALHDSEAVARAILDNAMVAIVTFDGDGVIETANPACEQMFGFTAPELVGRRIFTLLPDRTGALLRLVGSQREAVGRRRDGTIFAIDLSVSEVQVAEGQLYAAVINDISERKRAEEALRQNQRRLEDQAARLERHAAELTRSKREIERLAFVDVLTGLANRNLFRNRLAHAIALADRDGHGVALLLLDLNGFKAVNDALGHTAGDAALRVAGSRLGQVLREADTVARIGGDEFAAILETDGAPAGARAAAERIVAAFEAPIAVDGQAVPLGVAIGIAVYPQDAGDGEALFRAADAAMYRAKAEGASALAMADGTRTPLPAPGAADAPMSPKVA